MFLLFNIISWKKPLGHHLPRNPTFIMSELRVESWDYVSWESNNMLKKFKNCKPAWITGAQKKGKTNTNMSWKSTLQNAISYWQSAVAQTKQMSDSNVTALSRGKINCCLFLHVLSRKKNKFFDRQRAAYTI